MWIGDVRHGFDGHARLMGLDETVHQHAVAVFQAFAHNPLALGPAVQLHRVRRQLVVRGHHEHHLAHRAVDHGTLRHAQGVGPARAAQNHPDKLAGAQTAVRIGHLGPRIEAAGLGIDPFAGEIELAGARVDTAVGQLDRHRESQTAIGRALAGHGQLPAANLAGHAQQVVFRDAEVHVHRVGLHQGGQQAVACGNQAAIRLGRAARGAADGGHNAGIAQVQARFPGLRRGLLQRGLGRFQG